MGAFLRTVVTIYYGLMSGTMTYCIWADAPHFFTVYLENRTWNEARERCRSTGTQLLTITNQTDWEFWTEILNISQVQEHRSVNGMYWMGLHVPDPGAPHLLFWDNCMVPEYTEPIVYDVPATHYQCVVMWIRTHDLTEGFLDMWLNGIMCNETHPFICMTKIDERDCVKSCDELVMLTDQESCEVLCDSSSCQATYFDQLQLCHLVPEVYVNPDQFTICFLPSVDFTPTICSSASDKTVIHVTDENMNVTDTVCTEQQFVTNSTNSSVDGKQCACLCEKLWTFLATPSPEVVNLTIEEKTEIIVKELTVEKKNTTINQRKYVSVMDYRPSSIGIGIVAGIIIISVIAVIIIIDLSTIWHELQHILLRMYISLKPPVSRAKEYPQSDTTPSGDGFKRDNKVTTIEDNKPDIALSQMGGVGWFLRERSVYRQIAPVDAKHITHSTVSTSTV